MIALELLCLHMNLTLLLLAVATHIIPSFVLPFLDLKPADFTLEYQSLEVLMKIKWDHSF